MREEVYKVNTIINNACNLHNKYIYIFAKIYYLQIKFIQAKCYIIGILMVV